MPTLEQRAAQALAEPQLTEALRQVQDKTGAKRTAALAELGDLDAARALAGRIRGHTIDHLDHYLGRFVAAVEAAGAQVHLADDAAAATTVVRNLARARGVQRVVKGKSMVTEEIGLNAALEADGLEVLETDLGEYIVQLAGESPSHIIVPAIHKTRGQVRDLFAEHGGQGLSDDPKALTQHAREVLREPFRTAEMGITGCNLGVAATGTIALVTNEGNGRLCSTLPPIHVVVMGMERLVPDLASLDVMLALLPRAATGQRATSYVSLLTGPRRPGDPDGPEELHVVIVDNGRSELLGSPHQDLLKCVRCGACLNVCPVYRQIGGHAYDQVIPGPIGAALAGGRDPELPWACSLCGACDEVCPVGIPLAEHLLVRRQEAWNNRTNPLRDRAAGAAFAAIAGSPVLWRQVIRLAGSPLAPWRPATPGRRFRDWWKDQP